MSTNSLTTLDLLIAGHEQLRKHLDSGVVTSTREEMKVWLNFDIGLTHTIEMMKAEQARLEAESVEAQ